MKKTKIKKKKISNLIYFLVGGLFGGGIGVIYLIFGTNIIAILTSLVVWFYLGIVVHELGHLICGWISGYTFGSFRLGSLSWFIEDNVVKFKSSKNFVSGQCLMIPPDDEANFKFILYNLGGGLFNFLIVLVMLFFWYIFPSSNFLQDFIIVGIFINLFFGITNLIPLRSQGNDGANIAEALKSTDGKRAFYLIMYINGQLMRGKRINELDEETVCIYDKLNTENYLVGNVLMYELEYLLENNQAEKALDIAQQVNIDRFPTIYRELFNSTKLLIYVSYLPDFDKARAIYEEKNFQKFLKMKIPNVNFVLPAYEFFVNNDYEKAKKLLVQIRKDIDDLPNKGERLRLNDYLDDFAEKMESN